MTTVKRYLSLIKFSHTIFAMPFALIGFASAIRSSRQLQELLGMSGSDVFSDCFSDESDVPSTTNELLVRFALVMGCMVFARSAAMAFNRWLDAGFDSKNPRTAIREIPSGLIKANNALWFVIVSCAAFIACCWFINRLCFYLSFVALFIILFYSYTKRFTALCHIVLGLGLSLAPIGAYLAVTGCFGMLPLFFAATVLFWVSGFDIIYALQDEEFDAANALHSIPAALGKRKALTVSRILHLIAAATVICAGLYGEFGILYWIGAAGFIGMLIYQQSIVRHNDLSRVNIAFMTSNGIASIVFAIFVILDIFI